jgi:hypothetical protein
MTHDDIVDPRVVPRWVEAGVSGVPRAAEWDHVTLVDIPELEAATVGEIAFQVLAGGEVVHDGGVGPAVVDGLAAALGEHLVAPFEAIAVRQGALRWALAGKRVSLERIDLPSDLGASEITVARDPGGTLSVIVDGNEPTDLGGTLADVVADLAAIGESRHASFVVRAVEASGRWDLTVDPL